MNSQIKKKNFFLNINERKKYIFKILNSFTYLAFFYLNELYIFFYCFLNINK